MRQDCRIKCLKCGELFSYDEYELIDFLEYFCDIDYIRYRVNSPNLRIKIICGHCPYCREVVFGQRKIECLMCGKLIPEMLIVVERGLQKFSKILTVKGLNPPSF